MTEKALVLFYVMAGYKREACLRGGCRCHRRHGCCYIAKTGMPGTADKFTQSAQGRLLCPGMTKKAATATRLLGGRRLVFHIDDLHPAVDFRQRIGRILELGLAVSDGYEVGAVNAVFVDQIPL